MWQKIVAKAHEFIKIAEGFSEMSGAQKRAHVIKAMCDAIDLPYVPQWLENIIEPIIYGYVIDLCVKYWNQVTGHQLENIPDCNESAADMAEIVVSEVKAAATARVADHEVVDDKYQMLLDKYGVK